MVSYLRLGLAFWLAAVVLLALTPRPSPAQIPFWVAKPAATPTTPIQHVVVIMQENRSVDNFFNGFCASAGQCANTTLTGKDSTGATITLQPTNGGITTNYDPGHQNADWRAACDASGANSSTCQMDAFDKESCTGQCSKCQIDANHSPYCYVAQSYVQLYWNMATSDGVLSDETFQQNEGPSLNNHLYMLGEASYITPSSNLALIDNMTSGVGNSNAGCPQTGTQSRTVDMTSTFTSPTYAAYTGTGAYTGSGGCIDEPTITDLLDAAHLGWTYIQSLATPTGDGALWAAANNIYHICGPNVSNVDCESEEWSDHVQHPNAGSTIQAVLAAIVSANRLPTVTWIVPIPNNSDHPNTTTNGGPAYVASLVDTIGNSSYWNSTIIVVEWDDWGGWYDHVTPPAPAWNAVDPYEYGFRVPVILLSPYAKTGIVDHTTRGRECVNALIEHIFGLPYISAKSIDQYCEDNFIGTSLNFSQAPNPFVPI